MLCIDWKHFTNTFIVMWTWYYMILEKQDIDFSHGYLHSSIDSIANVHYQKIKKWYNEVSNSQGTQTQCKSHTKTWYVMKGDRP